MNVCQHSHSVKERRVEIREAELGEEENEQEVGSGRGLLGT